jgi:hypothetical protein
MTDHQDAPLPLPLTPHDQAEVEWLERSLERILAAAKVQADPHLRRLAELEARGSVAFLALAGDANRIATARAALAQAPQAGAGDVTRWKIGAAVTEAMSYARNYDDKLVPQTEANWNKVHKREVDNILAAFQSATPAVQPQAASEGELDIAAEAARQAFLKKARTEHQRWRWVVDAVLAALSSAPPARQAQDEYRCPRCGAQVDERFDCCQVLDNAPDCIACMGTGYEMLPSLRGKAQDELREACRSLVDAARTAWAEMPNTEAAADLAMWTGRVDDALRTAPSAATDQAQGGVILCVICGQEDEPGVHDNSKCPAKPQAEGGELSPCPFCGEAAVKHPDNQEWIACSNPACDAQQSGYLSFGAYGSFTAAEAWNRRAPTARANAELVKALRYGFDLYGYDAPGGLWPLDKRTEFDRLARAALGIAKPKAEG